MRIRHRKNANKAGEIPFGAKALTPDERALFALIARQGYVTNSERDELRYILHDGDFPQCTTRILQRFPPGSPESNEALTEWRRWRDKCDTSTGNKLIITEEQEQKCIEILEKVFLIPPQNETE